MNYLSEPLYNEAFAKEQACVFSQFLQMIALIIRRVIISPKAKSKSPLSLPAVAISAYYKYVIFI